MKRRSTLDNHSVAQQRDCKRGSTKAVYRCSTQILKHGVLKPPQQLPEQVDADDIEEVPCPYIATLVLKRTKGMKYWVLDPTQSSFEHKNCVGVAKPSTMVISQLSTMR